MWARGPGSTKRGRDARLPVVDHLAAGTRIGSYDKHLPGPRKRCRKTVRAARPPRAATGPYRMPIAPPSPISLSRGTPEGPASRWHYETPGGAILSSGSPSHPASVFGARRTGGTGTSRLSSRQAQPPSFEALTDTEFVLGSAVPHNARSRSRLLLGPTPSPEALSRRRGAHRLDQEGNTVGLLTGKVSRRTMCAPFPPWPAIFCRRPHLEADTSCRNRCKRRRSRPSPNGSARRNARRRRVAGVLPPACRIDRLRRA